MILYVTGGIGVGKSTVLSLLEGFGATVLRADDIVHDLLNDPEVQAQIAQAIGVANGGDRQEIAAAVFGDRDRLRRLEGILHPRVAQRAQAVHDQHPDGSILVYEVPLVPSPSDKDRVLLITAPESVRLSRLVRRGLSEQDARQRMLAQPSVADYRRVATHVIENTSDVESLRMALTQVWNEVTRDAGNL